MGARGFLFSPVQVVGGQDGELRGLHFMSQEKVTLPREDRED